MTQARPGNRLLANHRVHLCSLDVKSSLLSSPLRPCQPQKVTRRTGNARSFVSMSHCHLINQIAPQSVTSSEKREMCYSSNRDSERSCLRDMRDICIESASVQRSFTGQASFPRIHGGGAVHLYFNVRTAKTLKHLPTSVVFRRCALFSVDRSMLVASH